MRDVMEHVAIRLAIGH